MKIISICKKDYITTYFSFRKGLEYSGYNHDGYYITLLDDNNGPYYFNDNNFDEHFYTKKELRKEKLDALAKLNNA